MHFRRGLLCLLFNFSRCCLAQNALPPAELFFSETPSEKYTLSTAGEFFAKHSRIGEHSQLSIGISNQPNHSNLVTVSETASVTCSFWYSDTQLGYYAVAKDGTHIFALLEVRHASSEAQMEIRPLCRSSRQSDRLYVIGPISNPCVAAGMVLACASKEATSDQLFELNLCTGAWRELKVESNGITQWTASSTGTKFAGIRNRQKHKELVILESGNLKVLASCSLEDAVTPLAFDKSEKVLWVLSNHGADVDKKRLEEWNLETGEMRVLHADPKNEVDLAMPLIERNGKGVLGAYYSRGNMEFHSASHEAKEVEQAFTTEFGAGPVCILGDSDITKRRWIVSHESDTAPKTSYLFDRQTKKWVLLSPKPMWPPEHQLGLMRSFQFKGRDGETLNGYVTAQPATETTPRPTVLFVHGGPRMRNQWGYDPRVQFLASRGYVVAQVNFRGSDGFGKAFANAGNRQMGTGVMQHDLTDAVSHLIAQGVTDGKRVAIFGGSYGGYAALAGMTFTPDLFVAGIDFFGLSDLESYVREIPPFWQSTTEEFYLTMGNPKEPEGVKTMRAQSPLYSVSCLNHPVMILHGVNDQLVPIAQSDHFVREALRQAKSVDYLVLKSESHGFSDSRNETAAFVAIEKFLHEHLGGLVSNSAAKSMSARIDEWRRAADQRIKATELPAHQHYKK